MTTTALNRGGRRAATTQTGDGSGEWERRCERAAVSAGTLGWRRELEDDTGEERLGGGDGGGEWGEDAGARRRGGGRGAEVSDLAFFLSRLTLQILGVLALDCYIASYDGASN